MCSLSKEQSLLLRETIKNAYFFDLDFLSSFKHPATKCWHPDALLLFNKQIEWIQDQTARSLPFHLGRCRYKSYPKAPTVSKQNKSIAFILICSPLSAAQSQMSVDETLTNHSCDRQQFKNGRLFRLTDCMVFNAISNSISVLSLRPVHLSILSWSSFN